MSLFLEKGEQRESHIFELAKFYNLQVAVIFEKWENKYAKNLE